MMDLGAYSGLTSMLFAEAAGRTGRVFAFEPDPASFRITMRNIGHYSELTGKNNITVYNLAIWEHDQGVDFFSDGNMGARVMVTVSGRHPTCRIPSATLEGFVRTHALDRIDFVKCDIEGAERVVIPAARGLFARFKPRLIIEPHFVDGALTATTCREALERIGYQVEVTPQAGSTLPLLMATPAV